MHVRRTLSAAFALSLLVQLLVIGSAAAEDVDALMEDFAFVPTEIFIDPGDTVTWQNNDPAIHTVTRPDTGVRLGQAQGFGSTSVTFEEEEVVDLFCEIHPEMEVTVAVGDPQEESVEPVRLSATDTVSTSIAWSQERYSDGEAPFALLGRADVFADSLASGGPQGSIDAPLLLTGQAALDARTQAELERLGTRTVYVLGGSAAISYGVLASLSEAGISSTRVSGSDRVGTSVEVARRFFPGARSAIVARGFGGADPTQGFADSLAAGALAARLGIPVLLTATDQLSAETREYLESRPISSIIVAGGPSAVSEAVTTALEDMDIEVDRAGGANRFSTAVELLLRSFEGELDGVVYVDGGKPEAWADGFAAAGHQLPVLLTSGNDVPGATVAVQLLGGVQNRTCGTSVNAAACDKIDIAASADIFDPSQGVTALEGGNEVPGPGDDVASGAANVVGTSDPGTICFNVFTFDLDPPASAAHIHEGGPDVAGPVVIDLNDSGSLGDPSDRYGCSFGNDPDEVADILASPGDFYVNVHNAEFPAGAVRGQLFAPTAGYIWEGLGDFVVPGPGDPTGIGFAFMLAPEGPEQLCAFVGAFDFTSEVTAVEIRSKADDAVTATLGLPGPSGFGVRCISGPGVVDFRAAPEDFYLQMATVDHPDGAARGDDIFQLFGAPPGAQEFTAASAGSAGSSGDGTVLGFDVTRPFARR
jgi:putative cell wall-binding protein/plastocyanin